MLLRGRNPSVYLAAKLKIHTRSTAGDSQTCDALSVQIFMAAEMIIYTLGCFVFYFEQLDLGDQDLKRREESNRRHQTGKVNLKGFELNQCILLCGLNL